jgi:hypothetical protein
MFDTCRKINWLAGKQYSNYSGGVAEFPKVKKIQREYSDFSLNKNSLTLLVVNPRLVESNAVSCN